jgi:tetratricopeptide (TPR) repeat protein
VFARAAKSDENIMTAISSVVFLDIDCEKGDGPKLAEKYGIRAYPTYIMVNPQGEVTDAWVGYPGPEAWAQYVAAGSADRRTIPAKVKAYESEPTLALAKALANHASSASDYRASVEYYKKARELDPAEAGDYTQSILYSLYYGSGEDVFSAEEIKAEADFALASKDATAGDKVDLASLITDVAANVDDPEMAVPYIEAALMASEGSTDEEVIAGRKELEISHALIAQKDKPKALKLKKASMDEDWQDDLRTVNRFAYWCFENEVNLKEAEKLTMAGVDKAEDDTMRNRFLNTAAEICFTTGRTEEAIVHMKRILESDPDRGYFQRQLVRFEEALGEKAGG